MSVELGKKLLVKSVVIYQKLLTASEVLALYTFHNPVNILIDTTNNVLTD